MDSLPFAAVTATAATRAHVLSARPDAPVVPDRPRQARRQGDAAGWASWRRLRAGLAATLQAAARTVAPPERPQAPCNGALTSGA